MTKNLVIWAVIAVVLISLLNHFGASNSGAKQVEYSTFLSDVGKNNVKQAKIDGREIVATRKNNETYITYMPMYDEKLLDTLITSNVIVKGSPQEKQSLLMTILISWFPMILLIGIWFFIMRQMQGGGKGGPLSIGKNKAKMLTPDQVKTRFTDVAGCDEAKEEVGEVVEFLRDPTRFQNLGGRIPKGILMVGPPGTGKTLLAKAIAGEAHVPFFTISGSDFVEMFVGVGAARVRDLFEQAKKNAPCIIFIDEIDAVGRKRGNGFSGGHDEREQTLNQMLVEMDGFSENSGVIVIAATNRADVLDAALLRPGRFDRQVDVSLPDLRGREAILNVHIKTVPLASDVNVFVLARGTPGYSGADLANLVNEAALMAARTRKRQVTMNDFEAAKDKINMGTERRSLSMTKDELISTAYHEAGHAILGCLVPKRDPLHKVTIIPRGRALGVAFFYPEGDPISEKRDELEANITVLYGGRVAEGLIYGENRISTGASSDIKMATAYARAMVTQWGFSDDLGPLLYESDDNGYGKYRDISDETAAKIDEEVLKVANRNYARAKQLLEENIDILHAMKDALIKYETLDANQVDDLMNRREVRIPDDWDEKAATFTSAILNNAESMNKEQKENLTNNHFDE